MNDQISHIGYFTIDEREVAGDNSLVTQPETRCSLVRCECGWSSPAANLRAAKALLAKHQHAALGITHP